MEKKVLETIRRFNLLAPGDRVLVAVSGGPDSLCLLHLLARQAANLGITLHVAHINHGLRPEAADESNLVKKSAMRLGLPVTVCRVNVPAYRQKKGFSKQDAARRLRYRSLYRVAESIAANRIATAHHLDDRIETLLLRLLGGSGLDGLAGIPVSRQGLPGITLIRPLFNTSRSEIEEYCARHALSPALDRSNFCLDYMRNRVRLRLLPFLRREFGRQVDNSLAKTAELLRHDSSLLVELTEEVYGGIAVRQGNGSALLPVKDLLSLPQPLQMRIVRRAMWQAGVERPSAAHVQSVLRLARDTCPSAVVSLPGGFQAERNYEFIAFTSMAEKTRAPAAVCRLLVPGRTLLPWGAGIIEAEILPADKVSFSSASRNTGFLDLDLLDAPLEVRPRREGDRVRLLGAPGRRKVKDIMIDRKIPRQQRDTVPLLISGRKIAWLAGIEIGHEFRVTSATKNVLRLRFEKITEKE